jgi:hypothetical protein
MAILCQWSTIETSCPAKSKGQFMRSTESHAPKIDGRTLAGRRFKNLQAAYCSDLSVDQASITTGERALVAAASAIQIQIENESVSMLRGEASSGERMAALSDSALRIWQRLAARRGTNALAAE